MRADSGGGPPKGRAQNYAFAIYFVTSLSVLYSMYGNIQAAENRTTALEQRLEHLSRSKAGPYRMNVALSVNRSLPKSNAYTRPDPPARKKRKEIAPIPLEPIPTSCYEARSDKTCIVQECVVGTGKTPLVGMLAANGLLDKNPKTQFDFEGHCAVSVSHRFIFVHVPKTVGSSVQEFFRLGLCEGGMAGRDRCKGREDDFKLIGCHRAFEEHSDFFRFSFVRHPFSRAVSAWSMAMRRGFLTGEKISFDQWAMDPSKLETRLMAMHWLPQEQFVTTKGGCPVLDFVGMVGVTDRFNQDMEFVLGKIGSDRLWKQWKEKGFPNENTARNKNQTVEAEGMIKGQVAEELYKRYAKDFELFGFDRYASEYGQSHTSEESEESEIVVKNWARMDDALITQMTRRRHSCCYEARSDKTCIVQECNTGKGKSPLIGTLLASGLSEKTPKTQFDFVGHCAVSVSHRFIFVHVPRTVGSSVHEFFRLGLCENVKAGKNRCKGREDDFKLIGCHRAFEEHSDFFRFSFVRHPFSRAVSAWGTAIQPLFLAGEKISFDQWAMDPSKLETRLMALHWLPQEQFVTTKGGCPVLDFVGMVGVKDRFNRDMAFVLGKIGSDRLWKQWKEKGFPRFNTAKDKKQAVEAKGLIKGQVAEELYKRYAKDFELFGFDRYASEYGQSDTLKGNDIAVLSSNVAANVADKQALPVLKNWTRMDDTLIAQMTTRRHSGCYEARSDKTCIVQECNSGKGKSPLIGTLLASGLPEKTPKTQFDFVGHCAVSVSHRFIYVHVPKSAGSSVHEFFRLGLCEGGMSGRDRCKGREDDFKLIGCHRAFEEHSDFFRFSFVRHPFSRAVSAWSMAMRRGFIKGPPIPFDQWAMDPSKLETRLMAMHWLPQEQFVTTKGGCPVLDFVGMVGVTDRFNQDMEFVLGKIGSDRLWKQWKEKGFPNENTARNKNQTVEAEGMIKGQVAEELYKRYAKDFELFGFDRYATEYGQGLAWTKMDDALITQMTTRRHSGCYEARSDKTCIVQECNSGKGKSPLIGTLLASGLSEKTPKTQFDFMAHCAVSVSHRFIFVHVPKTVGSSVHEFFRLGLCEGGVAGRDRCKGREDDFKLIGCHRAFEEHSDFFRFSFVRHPFSRAVSAWGTAMRPGFIKGPPIPFDQWAMDPSKLETRLMALHWLPQEQFVTTKGGCPVLDFVGMVGVTDRFNQDMEFVLGKIGSYRLWKQWKEKGFPSENTSRDKKQAVEAKSMIKGQVAEELYKRYAKDFELFGFDAKNLDF